MSSDSDMDVIMGTKIVDNLGEPAPQKQCGCGCQGQFDECDVSDYPVMGPIGRNMFPPEIMQKKSPRKWWHVLI